MKLSKALKELLNLPTEEYEIFHEKTKIKQKTKLLDQRLWPKEWKKVSFKEYPRLENFILPEPVKTFESNLETVLYNRDSYRDFSKTPLTIDQISTLLYFSAGLKKEKAHHRGDRFYPSGGARYPLEIYLLSLSSELPKGFYHYNLKSHSLEKILRLNNFAVTKYFNYDFVKKASCILLISAAFRRSTIKYRDRGYRFTFIEAGHLGQNVYLICSALNLGCCAVAGFIEDKLNNFLGIDGLSETIIYTIAIGNHTINNSDDN